MNDRDFLRAALERGEVCLKPRELEAAAAGEGDAVVMEHISGCAHCSAEVELLRLFIERAPSGQELADVRRIEQDLKRKPQWAGAVSPKDRRTGFWSFIGRPWAVAAIAAALAVGVWVARPVNPALDSKIDATDVVRSGRVEGIAPTGDVAEPPAVVRWEPVAGAVRYQVGLQEVDGTNIWQQTTTGAQIALPEEARRLMLDRKTLLWVIAAEDAQGRVVARSGAQTFRVVRGAK